MDYTEEHIRFILAHWRSNEERCVRETGHSLNSIRLMFQNIGATYGHRNFGTGNPMYTRIADEYREQNLVFDETMTTRSFCLRFGIINE